MGQIALGNVTNASTVTAVRATANLAAPTSLLKAQAIQFQALGTNTGVVYIVDRATPNLALNVHAEVPPPSSTSRPAWSTGNPSGSGALNVADYYILPAVANEGVRVTAVTTP